MAQAQQSSASGALLGKYKMAAADATNKRRLIRTKFQIQIGRTLIAARRICPTTASGEFNTCGRPPAASKPLPPFRAAR